MKILAIDTSCDETCAAVTENNYVLTNVIWSQASAHAQFGGVMPSLAQRMHGERIDWVINQAISKSQIPISKIGAIAVTQGPGLAIALEVGISKAKELAYKLNIPLIPVNHVEGHLLSPLAKPNHKSQITNYKQITFPAVGLVVSGGHTELVLIEEIGKYKIVARTVDDALGEALDKAARMLGLGYPGGALLEKMARLGNPKGYSLPLPMARREDQNTFSYSGLKTAMWRLVESQKEYLDKQLIYDLAAIFQHRAFQHLERVTENIISQNQVSDLLVGGGVIANIELRNRLRSLGKKFGIKVHIPYSNKLIGDNAAMIGIAASYKITGNNNHITSIDRKPRWSVEEV